MAVRVLGTRQLRDELASVLDRLGELEEVVITRRGEGRAVLVGLERYNQLVERLEHLEDTLDALEGEREGAVPADDLFE
jgi:prevent-host-death family protein